MQNYFLFNLHNIQPIQFTKINVTWESVISSLNITYQHWTLPWFTCLQTDQKLALKTLEGSLGGRGGLHSSLTGQRTGPVGWAGGSRKTQKHYMGFPDTDGSASHCHSWGSLYKSLLPFRIFPLQCRWLILTSKSLSKCSKKAEQMQLLSDANNENKLKERQESHVMEVKLHCLDMKCIDFITTTTCFLYFLQVGLIVKIRCSSVNSFCYHLNTLLLLNLYHLIGAVLYLSPIYTTTTLLKYLDYIF